MKFRDILIRLAFSLFAVLAAFMAGAIVLSWSGFSPMEAYRELFQGGLGLTPDWRWGDPLIGRPVRLGNMLNEAAILILIAIAVSIPLWCGLINIGAEGQFLMGGLGAILAALYLGSLPVPLHFLAVFLSGALFGGFWGGLAGAMRVYRGMNEIITTIMLNFIAFWLTSFLTHGPLKDTTGNIGYPWTKEIPDSLRLPFIWSEGRLLLVLPFAVAVVAAAWLLARRTRTGFEMRAAGLAPGAAGFVGFPVARLQILSMFLSGAISGFAGACLLLGLQFRFSDVFASNYGFDALAVVLVGQGNPLGVAAAGILFGVLRTGAEAMEVAAGVPKSLGVVLQALTLFFLLLVQGRALAAWWRKFRTRRALNA